jgi:mycothiol synthase
MVALHPFTGSSELAQMADLVYVYPERNFHVVDLSYRLASWAVSDPRNIALWKADDGTLVGWAVAQLPFASLDYAIHPDLPNLEEAILEWGIQRWAQVAQERGQRIYFYIAVPTDQHERIALLERHGLKPDDWGMLQLAHPLNFPVPEPTLPNGFTIRPLAGSREVRAYTAVHRAAFGSENMREDWRSRILETDQYIPDLDLVAVAPDGSLAAFCICWIKDLHGQSIGQVEPLGVAPQYQKMGLGRAILNAGLRAMQDHGATSAYIQTETTNPASHLYHSTGYETLYATTAYFRVFDPALS